MKNTCNNFVKFPKYGLGSRVRYFSKYHNPLRVVGLRSFGDLFEYDIVEVKTKRMFCCVKESKICNYSRGGL